MEITAIKKIRINDQISVSEVRLIGADGKQLGVVSRDEALKAAQDEDLDLVEISPTAKPPVCRIMDFGKFRFEQSKKQQVQRRKQKQIQVKEIKFRPTTEEGDYQVKLRNLIRFLENGDKAKVSLRFRGREMVHQELGMRLMIRLQEDLQPYGTVEQMPKLEGRQLVMILSPTKKT